MPHAEHAPVPQSGPPGLGTGSVIHVADRFRRPGAAPAPEPDPSRGEDPAQELAFSVQAHFAKKGRSLHNAGTREDFDTTLEFVSLLMGSARANEVVGEDQYQALLALLGDMRQAPELV